jgi:hypothetical protein
VQNNLKVDGTTNVAQINVSGNIVPTASGSFTLGTSQYPFKEIFVGSGSISIQSPVSGTSPTTISNNDGNLEISAGGIKLIGTGSFISATGSFQYVSGNVSWVGNNNTYGYISASGGFSGSLLGTASYALNAGTAQTASYATNAGTAQTASYVQTAQTASYVQTAQTASYVQNAQTASYVATASYATNAGTAQTASYALSSAGAAATGSWTPTLLSASADPTRAIGISSSGYYVKNGNIVTAYGTITCTSFSGSTTTTPTFQNISFGGLPFTAADSFGPAIMGFGQYTDSIEIRSSRGYTVSGTKTFVLYEVTGGNSENSAQWTARVFIRKVTQVGQTPTFTFIVTYRTNE